MSFGIEFVEQEASSPDVLLGRFIAGTLDEKFDVVLGHWSRADYEASWCREIQNIINGEDRAALMTVALEPMKSNWLRAYTLFRFDKEIRVQERMFLLEDFNFHFDLSRPGKNVPPHQATDEDGDRLSEWIVTIEELRNFLGESCRQK